MDMDVEYQYETFNGLPVYYGGDIYDSEDAEDDTLERARAAYVEDYNFDVPEGKELLVCNRRRPDGGEARNVDTVDMVPMCRTVAGVTCIAPDDSSYMSGTDTAELISSDLEVSAQWPDLSDEKDCFGSDVGSSVDGSLSFSDFDSVDSKVDFCFDSDEGSVAELKWNTWDEACALEFQHASVVFLPDSTVVRPAVNIKDDICDMGDSGHPAWDVGCTGRAFDTQGYVGCVDDNIYMARLCLLGQSGMENMMQWKEEYVDKRGWSHGHTVIWNPGVAES